MKSLSCQSGILSYQDNKIHCLRMGQGSNLIIALHGFGQDASIFQPLSALLSEDYSLIAVDLPGHGRTQWRQSDRFDKTALMTIIQGIKQNFGSETFTLLGDSMGARLALCVVEQQALWLDKLVLLAPDGLQKNIWYRLATRNPLGKLLFRYIVTHPGSSVAQLRRVQQWGLGNNDRIQTAITYLTDEQKRNQVAEVWPLMRHLVPHPEVVKWNLNKKKIPCHLFLGKRDPLFPMSQGYRFQKNLKNCSLTVLDTGHQVLKTRFLSQIAAALANGRNDTTC